MFLYQMTPSDLAIELNSAKDLLLFRLAHNGIITGDEYQRYSLYYTFVVEKPSKLSAWWRRLWGNEEDGEEYKKILLPLELGDND